MGHTLAQEKKEDHISLTKKTVLKKRDREMIAQARHAEAEHGDCARLGVAEWFEVNPVEGRGRKADPVAQEHR